MDCFRRFLSLGLQHLVLSLLMAVTAKASLFVQSSFVLLLLGFFGSLLSFLAFALAIHTLFDKARIGGLFSVVVRAMMTLLCEGLAVIAFFFNFEITREKMAAGLRGSLPTFSGSKRVRTIIADDLLDCCSLYLWSLLATRCRIDDFAEVGRPCCFGLLDSYIRGPHAAS